MKASVLRYAAIGMATLSLAGFAAASTVSIGTTGPDSDNHVSLHNSQKLRVNNLNAVGVTNFNAQSADTGDVHAAKNTEVSGANGSGDASNSNATNTSVSLNNSSSSALLGALASGPVPDDHVTLNLTGPDSDNTVHISNTQSLKLNNNNLVNVENVNLQSATSGDVSAFKNTSVGGLSSGDAHNSNTTTTSVTISN
jgi:hypothetical protein